MDDQRFDAASRMLGAAGSRRQAIAGALGALLGGGMLDAEAGNKGNGKSRPNAEGPCGNGSRKENICTRDKDCCTGICKTGLKNIDGKGRCRCQKKGKTCTADKNCCNGMTCSGGVCSKDTCGGAICAAGEQCLHGGCTTCSCAACDSIDCSNPTVASGGSVQAAIDAAGSGAVITIAPGTYSESLVLPAGASLTLVGCGIGADEVVLINSALIERTIDATAGATLDLIDIVVQGYNDLPSSLAGGGIELTGTLNICARSRVEECIDSYGGGIYIAGPDASTISHLLVTDRAIIQRNFSPFGAGVAMWAFASAEVTGSAQIVDNHIDTYGGGFYLNSTSDLRLAGAATISGNSAGQGGGVYLNESSSLTVEENATITNNAADGAGGGVYGYPSGGSTLDAVSGSITGNTPDDCGGALTC